MYVVYSNKKTSIDCTKVHVTTLTALKFNLSKGHRDNFHEIILDENTVRRVRMISRFRKRNYIKTFVLVTFL